MRKGWKSSCSKWCTISFCRFHNIFTPEARTPQSMFKGYNKWISQLQPQWCQRVQKVSAVSDHYPQVENFLMNPTFTSKGGFRIMLNGVTIYQVVKIPTMSSSFCLWLSTPWDQLREKREPNYLKYCIKWFQLMFLNLCNSHCNWSYDTMWGPVMKAFPKRYKKSDGLQVQLWRVGARRHETWDP